MRVTIVRDDNLVIIDQRPIHFDLAPFALPAHLRALQWRGDQGEIEYDDGTLNEVIDDLTPYQPIIDEYHRLTALEDQPPPPTEAEQYRALVARRDVLLNASDWLVQRHDDQHLIGAPASIPYDQFLCVQQWRQALRELPETYFTSDSWVWPEVPDCIADLTPPE